MRNARIALFYFGFSILETFLSWKELGKPYLAPSIFYVGFYILVIAELFILRRMFRCFGERLVVGIATLGLLRGIIIEILPNFVASVSSIMRPAFVALWVFASIFSLGMFIQLVRTPYVHTSRSDLRIGKKGILCSGRNPRCRFVAGGPHVFRSIAVTAKKKFGVRS